MARKQSDYLADLLAEEGGEVSAGSAPSSPAPARASSALLGRESALARVASGQVRQVTQLLLDPGRVRIWPGNARQYAHLNAENCRELIDSIIAEGGQKVPAVVRRVENDPDHDYEVIAGTRRHWSISWLRAHSYPDMVFVAQVAQLDDEAAFRLADLENRARKDVSDLERARNYAAALNTHYDGHLTRMAERLKLSKGWLSKMIRVAGLPDIVIDAFPSPADIPLKPSYALVQALDNPRLRDEILAVAAHLAGVQKICRAAGEPPRPADQVLRDLMTAGQPDSQKDLSGYSLARPDGRPMLSVQSVNRQGVTIRLHAGSGASIDDMAAALREALGHLERSGRGLQA